MHNRHIPERGVVGDYFYVFEADLEEYLQVNLGLVLSDSCSHLYQEGLCPYYNCTLAKPPHIKSSWNSGNAST